MPPPAACLPLLLFAWLGFHGPIAEVGPLYLLPFPVGSSYPVLQGYDGKWGHQGAAAYAYDFQMPIGSRVAAARAGVVVRTEASHADATRKGGEENFVFVDHGDGTFGRYYHLTRGGVLVSVGQRVVAGQEIGRSGDSGASAGPHLHFDVTRGCPDWGCQTIPVRFENSASNPLLQGQEARALPPASADDRGARRIIRDTRADRRSSRADRPASREDRPGSRESYPGLRKSFPDSPESYPDARKVIRIVGKVSRDLRKAILSVRKVIPMPGKVIPIAGKVIPVLGKAFPTAGKIIPTAGRVFPRAGDES